MFKCSCKYRNLDRDVFPRVGQRPTATLARGTGGDLGDEPLAQQGLELGAELYAELGA